MDRSNIAAQLVRRADEWVRRAPAADLLHVMFCGGLSAVIVEDGGFIRTGVELGRRRDRLCKLGMIWTDLPPDDTLAIFAEVWGVSRPPTAEEQRAAWLASEPKAMEGARRFLHAEIDENMRLFEAVVADWIEMRRARYG